MSSRVKVRGSRMTESSTSSTVRPCRTMWPYWIVCVGAWEGFNELLPSGTKLLSATASACGPERRITARPPSPRGVAIAAMVSSSIDQRRTGFQPVSGPLAFYELQILATVWDRQDALFFVGLLPT